MSHHQIFQCPLSLVFDLHICWNTLGCLLCSSDQLCVSLVLRGSGLCSHLSRCHLEIRPQDNLQTAAEQSGRLFKVSSKWYLEVNGCGPTFLLVNQLWLSGSGPREVLGAPFTWGLVRANLPLLWNLARKKEDGGWMVPAVQAIPGGRIQKQSVQSLPAFANCTLRPPRNRSRSAAARARALRGPAPAPQNSIPRVACCRRHRFPTCVRPLRALAVPAGPPGGRALGLA